MALTDDNGMVMPVSPMYGGGFGSGYGNGFGGDWAWIILLLLLGWGNNGFGGYGGGGNELYPWMNQAELTQGGFRDQMINGNITSIRDGLGDISTQLCSGFAGVNAGVASGFAQAEIAANGRQMADMNQNFALQSGIADLKYTIATEECATRNQSVINTRDIMENDSRNHQAVMDKLCQLELDGVKAQLAQAERENLGLQNQLNMATMQNGMNSEVDALYNRLKNCPVPSMPVYGNAPIFTCGNNGCGCGGNF